MAIIGYYKEESFVFFTSYSGVLIYLLKTFENLKVF